MQTQHYGSLLVRMNHISRSGLASLMGLSSAWLAGPVHNLIGRRGVIFFTGLFCVFSILAQGLTRTWWELPTKPNGLPRDSAKLMDLTSMNCLPLWPTKTPTDYSCQLSTTWIWNATKWTLPLLSSMAT